MSYIHIHNKLGRSANEDTVLCSLCICGKLLSKHMVTDRLVKCSNCLRHGTNPSPINKESEVNRLQDSLGNDRKIYNEHMAFSEDETRIILFRHGGLEFSCMFPHVYIYWLACVQNHMRLYTGCQSNMVVDGLRVIAMWDSPYHSIGAHNSLHE